MPRFWLLMLMYHLKLSASGGGLESLYMTTFSRDQFTFNGWGEFVVLQTGYVERKIDR